MLEYNLYDLEKGLVYSNFIVKDITPKIITWMGFGKDELITDLVTTTKFNDVTNEVYNKLITNGKTILIGSRGIGKSTVATYVTWKLLLDKKIDGIIKINRLDIGDGLHLNNLINHSGNNVLVIYDPSPIEVYYKPEAMQSVEIESIKNTFKELEEVSTASVITVLPTEFYETTKELDENSIINVSLKDKEFLKEVIKKYSGCYDVSDDLVNKVMDFDTYTLVAKYVGIYLNEKQCKDSDNLIKESIKKPKLFYANYIWGSILRKNIDMAKRVSVPLTLYAAFGSIPEEVTYITKAIHDGGVWKLIERDTLEDLKENDLEPLAKWLSIRHEDLIREVLKDLAGLNGKEIRKLYIEHGFKGLINALDWGYEKVLKALNQEVNPEKIIDNLSTFLNNRKTQCRLV